jgi:hypothetical protein
MLSLLFSQIPSSSAQDARALLREVNRRFEKVHDYSASVRIRTDIPFVRMMPVNAKVEFVQPDRFTVRSSGIALLPKQGFETLFKNLRDTISYLPVPQGRETLRNVPVSVVSILPVSDTSDLILGRLWVDEAVDIILRSQLTTRSNGTVTADYYFGKYAAFALPDSMTFTIDTRKFKIPKAVSADLNNTSGSKGKQSPERQKGMIYLQFTDYRINRGPVKGR